MEDLRKTKTKTMIQNALIDLLKVKHVHCISITDICKTAKINRSTFYSHYEDFQDFLQQTMQEAADGLTLAVSDSWRDPNLLLKKEVAYQCYCKWFSHVYEYRELFSLLLGPNGSKEFDDLILDQGIDWYNKLLQPVAHKLDKTIPIDIFINYIVNAHYGLLKFYIKSNYKYSIECMAQKLTTLTFSIILSSFGIFEEKK